MTTTDNVTEHDLRALIQSDGVKAQMAMVLPKHLTADRMARVACLAILKTPKLAACKSESLLQALMLCSQAGLEPDGRNAHLIPFGDQVQVIFDWKGLVALARRNGVQNIAADIVCEHDVFIWHRTVAGLQFEHKIDLRQPRGEMFAAFCVWKDGDQFDGDVMTKAEIEGIRKRSRAANAGPWVTDYHEMAKKTVVRRAAKKWPLDAELAEALNEADATALVTTVSSSRPIFNIPDADCSETRGTDNAPTPLQPVDGVPLPLTPVVPVATEPRLFNENGVTTANYVKWLRGLLNLAQLTEVEFLDYMQTTFAWDDSLHSLDAIAALAPANLQMAYDEWPDLLMQLHQSKPGAKK